MKAEDCNWNKRQKQEHAVDRITELKRKYKIAHRAALKLRTYGREIEIFVKNVIVPEENRGKLKGIILKKLIFCLEIKKNRHDWNKTILWAEGRWIQFSVHQKHSNKTVASKIKLEGRNSRMMKLKFESF